MMSWSANSSIRRGRAWHLPPPMLSSSAAASLQTIHSWSSVWRSFKVVPHQQQGHHGTHDDKSLLVDCRPNALTAVAIQSRRGFFSSPTFSSLRQMHSLRAPEQRGELRGVPLSAAPLLPQIIRKSTASVGVLLFSVDCPRFFSSKKKKKKPNNQKKKQGNKAINKASGLGRGRDEQPPKNSHWVAEITPILVLEDDDDFLFGRHKQKNTIYFRSEDRLDRKDFDKVLKVYREFKNRPLKFDGDAKMWYLSLLGNQDSHDHDDDDVENDVDALLAAVLSTDSDEIDEENNGDEDDDDGRKAYRGLLARLRQRFGRIRVRLRPLEINGLLQQSQLLLQMKTRGRHSSAYNDSSSQAIVESYYETVNKTRNGSLSTVVLAHGRKGKDVSRGDGGGATSSFLIIPPTIPPDPLKFGIRNHHGRTQNWLKINQRVREILEYELTGVTDLVEYTGVVESSSDGSFTIQAYQTYDIWLVAELLQLLENDRELLQHYHLQKQKSQLNKDNVEVMNHAIVSDAAKRALDERFDDKYQRRKPIPQLEKFRNASVSLHPHQLEGVRFFMDNGGRGLLGDEMGLGKTMTALAYVAATEKRAVAIVPKKVLGQWETEAQFSFPLYFENQTCVLGSHIKKGQEADTLDKLKEARLVCLNYEVLERFLPIVVRAGFDTIILDESHWIKNPDAKRTKLVLENKEAFLHRILLSGTPVKNRAEEFASQLEFLGMEDAKDKVSVRPGKLWNTLQERNLYLRRSIQAELPHLRFKDPEIVDAPDPPEELQGFEGAFEIQELDSKGRLMIKKMVEQRLRETALFKAPFSAQLARDLAAQYADDKMIIFTERVACAKNIYSALTHDDEGIGEGSAIALLHYGEQVMEERQAILDSFMHTGPNSPRILVSTRQSLGIGMNLQCANRVIFNDMAWTPADILQAAARTKRLNQKKEVSEYWILADTDFDNNLVDILQQKRNLIRMYSEGKNISAEDEKWMNQRVSYLEILFGPDYRKKASAMPEEGPNNEDDDNLSEDEPHDQEDDLSDTVREMVKEQSTM